jgi:hypothetical protein
MYLAGRIVQPNNAGAGKLGSGDKSIRFRLADRVGAIDHYAYSVFIFQREFLAAVCAQPEMLDGTGMRDLASRYILLEAKQTTLAVVERDPAIRICTR